MKELRMANGSRVKFKADASKMADIDDCPLRLVAVVQARLGSKRLPGKVLADIGGEPALARLLRFLGTVKGLDDIVLAVPYNDLFLLDMRSYRGPNDRRRGPEDDVLARFIGAAEATNADAVVRITADCPLLDPEAVTHLVRVYRARPCEYMAYRPEVRGLQSVEILSTDALHRLNAALWSDDSDREHAGVSYILRDEGQFAVTWVNPQTTWTVRPPYRLCVDTADDLEVVRALLRKIVAADKVIAALSERLANNG